MAIRLFSKKKPVTTDIFMHIHKTGGTTLMNLLDDQYSVEDTYLIDGRKYRRSINELVQTAKSGKVRPLRLVKGHQLFGIHDHLPGDYRYFAMMREPISRIISLYNYLRQIDLFPVINNRKLTITEFIEKEVAFAADNGMVRFVSGYDLDEYPYGSIDESCVETAISNIDNHFCFVGLLESFDLSLLAFKQVLGWKEYPYYEVSNKTKSKFRKDNFSTEEIDYLKEYLKHDIMLYEYVKTGFEKNVIEILGADYQAQLNEFKSKLISQ